MTRPCSLNARDAELRDAIRAGDIELIETLVAAGADINAVEVNARSGWFPIMKYAGSRDVIRALVRCGANLGLRDPRDNTTWLHRVAGWDCEITQWLLDCGAGLEARDDRWQTPLFYAVRGDKLDITRLLLERGANPDAQDNTGDPAMYTAFIHGNVAMVRLLLEFHASVTLVNNMGDTPLKQAVTNASFRGVEMVQVILEAGADPNLTYRPDKQRPIHIAACYHNIEAAKLLIRFGADFNALDANGNTPLDIALIDEAFEFCHWLASIGGRSADDL